jgi:3',5'-cyclic AMP phosphodiesterase CpdA
LINGHRNADTCRAQFAQWKETMQPLLESIPVYMGVGSHEMAVKPTDGLDGDSLFREEFYQVPWNGPDNLKGLVYSFDFGNSHFVMLDSYTRIANFQVTEDQLEWLEKDLASTNKLHRFVGLHDVPYPNHAHLKSSLNIYPEMLDKFLVLCDKYGVEIIFCGHEHNYERKLINSQLNPKVKGWIYQVKNGTCGAPIYTGNTDTRNQQAFAESYNYVIVDVKGPHVLVTAYDENGKVLDQFSYKK